MTPDAGGGGRRVERGQRQEGTTGKHINLAMGRGNTVGGDGGKDRRGGGKGGTRTLSLRTVVAQWGVAGAADDRQIPAVGGRWAPRQTPIFKSDG
eukprot:6392653-Pyramimonas_sp.AAC.1